MLRRFNYTNRIRILNEDARIFLHSEKRFGIEVKLEEYSLPEDAFVYVEAYRQTTLMRFYFGTVNTIIPPERTSLDDFDSLEDILFRIKITSAGNPDYPVGVLLAEADRLRLQKDAKEPEPREPLLPVLPMDLGPELWRLDFDDHPCILFNANAGNYRQVVSEPSFIALVYPAVIREILLRILVREKHTDFDDLADWRSRWLYFASEVLGVGEPPLIDDQHDDEIDEWIGEAVKAFCQKNDIVERFASQDREEKA